jgi:hypothetical protein
LKKLTEAEKLKYWLDMEFTILHTMFGIIMWQLTTGWLPHLFWGAYIFISILYLIPRAVIIAANDPNYLRVPKK